jgi:hypothetical protein
LNGLNGLNIELNGLSIGRMIIDHCPILLALPKLYLDQFSGFVIVNVELCAICYCTMQLMKFDLIYRNMRCYKGRFRDDG